MVPVAAYKMAPLDRAKHVTYLGARAGAGVFSFGAEFVVVTVDTHTPHTQTHTQTNTHTHTHTQTPVPPCYGCTLSFRSGLAALMSKLDSATQRASSSRTASGAQSQASATRRMVARLSPTRSRSFRLEAARREATACITRARARSLTSGFSSERIGRADHTPGRRCLRLRWRCVMKMPAALRVRFLRPAWPDCSLLGVTRLNGVPAQSESSAPPWSKASRHDAWAVRRSLQDRAGRVSSRCNFSRSSDATVQVRRFAVGHAINLLKGLGSRIEKVLFAVYSRPQNIYCRVRTKI